MKKLLGITGLVILVLLTGCKTTGEGTSSGNTVEESYQNVYNRYKGDLILEGATSYTVKKGDTLNGISRDKYNNNGFYYPVIMLASSEVVLDPDNIEPGMQLIVPDLQVNLNDAKAKGRIKLFLGEIAVIEDTRNRGSTANGLRELADSL